MSNARHHHYLSQCYLKGFTQGNSKKSKLTVFDLKSKKMFETIPRNVGGIRDFNRIEVDGLDPNTIEKMQSEFEGKVAKALKELNQNLDFSGEVKDLILQFIAMLAIRSPEMREHLSKPLTKIAETIISSNVASKERWETQIKKMKEETGEDILNDISYDEIKQFVDEKRYNIEINQEHQIRMELTGMDTICELLHQRNWQLIKVSEDSGEFITSDKPVSLTWNFPDKVPEYISPGFGLKNTMVYFPVSKNLSLVGEFDRDNGISQANQILVSMLNSKVIANCYKRLFASKSNFDYIAKGHQLKKGNTLLMNA